MNEGPRPSRLVVFSDDWGRHPSSSQHLVGHLLAGHDVLWVNTVGTRRPGLTRADLSRAMRKVGNWIRPGHGAGLAVPEGLRVIHPKMWPGFRRPWQRRLNAGSITRHVEEALGHRSDEQRIAITTLPITADLVGRIDVDRWVYYCVDDFSVWPGLDSDVMQAMERELVAKVDDVVVVSETLRDRIKGMGRDAELLTHGIEHSHWRASGDVNETPTGFPETDHPAVLFWGLIDRRLDMQWCGALAEALQQRGGTLVLAGPQQSPDPSLHRLPNVQLPGPVAYSELPAWAAKADVLVMPYADAPVTRAMQPLKLKEYLATGKPVVVRDLPATRAWRDAADVVDDVDTFVNTVITLADTGLTIGQAQARARLAGETWAEKARLFASVWGRDDKTPMRIAA
jgi:glycosyltransferase involved in cell wall biosynthesis